MGKQKSVAELKNLRRELTIALETMDPADKKHRAVASKLKAVNAQIEQTVLESGGMSYAANEM